MYEVKCIIANTIKNGSLLMRYEDCISYQLQSDFICFVFMKT